MDNIDVDYGDRSGSDTSSPRFNDGLENSQPPVQNLPSIPRITATLANSPQLTINWSEAKGQKPGLRAQTRSEERTNAYSSGPAEGSQDSSPAVLKTPLNTFRAEVRRTKLPTLEENQRNLTRISNLYQAVIEQLSLFPGTARFFLNKYHPGVSQMDSHLASAAARDDETEQAGPEAGSASSGKGHNSLSAVTEISRSIDPEQLQELVRYVDEIQRSVRDYGINHESSRLYRDSLSREFCRVPMPPQVISSLIEQLKFLAKQQHLQRHRYQGLKVVEFDKRRRNKALIANMNHRFVLAYGLEYKDFRQIVGRVSRHYLDWQKERNRIANTHLRLIVYLARKYSSNPNELNDLIQEGNIGLIKAVERFNYRLGFRFSTYATCWIKQEISRYLARNNRAIRVPYRQSQHLGIVRKKREQFQQLHGRLPTTMELVRESGISESRLRKLDALSQTVASLDAPLDYGDNLKLNAMLEQHVYPQPDDATVGKNVNQSIEKAIGTLNQREAFVIRQRFGIGVYAEKTLQELGSSLGITRERVRQIQISALKKIRFFLEPLMI
jgi:RNA polymerase sigma factor (sigma-70 family)